MTTLTLVAGAPPRDRLEWAAVAGLLGFVSALQLSIAAASICLAVTLTCWAGALVLGQERWDAPRFFWPLLVYAAWTLISAAGSPDPRTSFIDSKQLVVFLLVPAVYQLARGNRALTIYNVIITVGAASAILGIVQYGLLNYDHLGQRPQGAMGHYMTYSGLLVLVIAAAVGRLLFDTRHCAWSAIVMPALAVAIALTFTRSAWVGVAVAVARAVHPQGRAAAGAAAGDCRRGVPARAGSDHRPLLLDVRPARSHQPRSRGDAVRRPQDDRGASHHRRGPEHGGARVRGVSRPARRWRR